MKQIIDIQWYIAREEDILFHITTAVNYKLIYGTSTVCFNEHQKKEVHNNAKQRDVSVSWSDVCKGKVPVALTTHACIPAFDTNTFLTLDTVTNNNTAIICIKPSDSFYYQ